MTTRLANYDSEAVDLIVCDISIADGRDKDEFVTVDQLEDSFGEEQSADGLVVRHNKHPRLFDVTVKLSGASKENAKLMSLHALDVNATNGFGIGAFLLKDRNGSTLCSSDKCWIVKPPSKGFGENVKTCEWKIRVVATPAQMLIGGN